MALSKKALQRKRQKKKKKRQIRTSNLFLVTTVDYSNWPIYECWMPTELWETGIGQIVISRKNNKGEIAVGMYLIDVFCLGIKNCFVRLTHLDDYKDMLEHITGSCGELKSIEPVYANTLIYKAAEYAKQFGFKPHADFVKARNLLKNIPLDEDQLFTFGKDGKPCYIQGPNESRGDVKKILKTLELNQGSKNYHFVLEVPDNPDLLLEH